jgi:hypothetical protein
MYGKTAAQYDICRTRISGNNAMVEYCDGGLTMMVAIFEKCVFVVDMDGRSANPQTEGRLLCRETSHCADG